jgi:hypothetical protein
MTKQISSNLIREVKYPIETTKTFDPPNKATNKKSIEQGKEYCNESQ